MYINYAKLWKTKLGFKEFNMSEFIEKFSDSGEAYRFQEKIDGQLAAFVYEKGKKSYLISINGKMIEGIDVIQQYERVIEKRGKNINQIVIIGELTAFINGRILPFNESQSIIKTPYRGNNGSLIHHFVYDIFMINGMETRNYQIIFKHLLALFDVYVEENSRIHLIETIWGKIDKLESSFETLTKIHAPAVDGIVIRTYKGMTAYKIKMKNTYDVAVIGIGNTKMVTYGKNQMSYLIVAFRDKNGDFLLTSKVGTGFKTEIRKWFFDYAMKFKLYETDKGEIFFAPKIVVEISSHGLRKELMPAYMFKNNIYISRGKKPSVTMRFPTFLRFRPDKKPNIYDVRIDQIG